MALIQALLFLALSLSISGLVFSESLITFSNQNTNNSLHSIAVQILLFFLTFTIAIILLLLHVAMPQSVLFINYLTTTTRVLITAILLLGTPHMIYVAFAEAVRPDTLMVMYIGAVVVAEIAGAAAYNYNPFKRYFSSAGRTFGSFVPAFVAVCISTGTFLFIYPLSSFSDQNHGSTLVHTPIQFLLSLNFLNFVLAMWLLLLRISVPADGTQVAIPAVPIKHLVTAMLVMSIAIVVIIGLS